MGFRMIGHWRVLVSSTLFTTRRSIVMPVSKSTRTVSFFRGLNTRWRDVAVPDSTDQPRIPPSWWLPLHETTPYSGSSFMILTKTEAGRGGSATGSPTSHSENSCSNVGAVRIVAGSGLGSATLEQPSGASIKASRNPLMGVKLLLDLGRGAFLDADPVASHVGNVFEVLREFSVRVARLAADLRIPGRPVVVRLPEQGDPFGFSRFPGLLFRPPQLR